jgi:lambda family phage portal protein
MARQPVRYRIKGTNTYIDPNRVRVRSGNFDASSRGRTMLKWSPSSDGATSALIGGLTTMRNRARDLARNNPWCVSALDSLVANVTDPAIMPISQAKDDAFKDAVRLLWADWGKVADAQGVLSWDLLVGLAYRSMVESGEVFLRMRDRFPEDGLPVPLQIQIIESDHCPIHHTVTPANPNHKVVAGIEFDPLGRRVAYWMYPEHPGESVQQTGINLSPVRVPAEEIIHLYDPTRPGQIRGLPKMTSVIKRLYDLNEYEDAELTKKKISSLFVGSIQSPAPDSDLLDEEEGLDEQENVNWARLEPGTIVSMEPGEQLSFNDPPAADSSYEPHVKMQLRSIAIAYGVTYEQMTGDLTGVNFSSIRAGLNEFQRRARRSQRLLMHQLCHRVWNRWMDAAVLSGAISAPSYATNRADYARVEWRGPGWKYVNPQQEIAAIREEIAAGLTSRQDVAAEQGRDIVEIDRKIAEDKARAEALGLSFEAKGAAPQLPAPAQVVTPPEPDEDDVEDVPAVDGVRSLMSLSHAMRKAEEFTQIENQKVSDRINQILGDGDE